jgi:precorrin-4/cobalt-precorrin-4 C11-methyltransferase
VPQVYFIGAGPGDPELLTIKAKKVIQRADVIIYAGSLVNAEIMKLAPLQAEIYNSAELSLEEITALIVSAVNEDKMVARLHSGDPSIYGAIGEQMEYLKQQNIPFEVIPGVSSFSAAAAALKVELTLPEISQSVILTRLGGRTEVPQRERLSSLASHQATMCIFLSIRLIEEVVAELEQGYSPDTPVAVVEHASLYNEKIVRGKLKDITPKVREAGMGRTAMIIVGEAIDPGKRTTSRLYNKGFTHSFRKGKGEGSRSGHN